MATQADIQSIYQKELGRAADPGGLDFYTGLANQGVSLQDIAKQISASQEGIAKDPSGQVQWTAASTQNPVQNFDLEGYLNQATDMFTKAAQASAQANQQNAQAATAANRVNQITPFGNLNYTQSGTDAQGNPIWTATQTLSPQLQQAYGNISGQVANQYGQAFAPNLPSYGINPGETYSDAIMRRLQPQQERESKQLETQLANQGIMPGSQAYDMAKTQLAQKQNDQLTSATIGGFNTGLAANQQAYNQALNTYQLPMATLNQLRTGAQPTYVNPSQQATVAGPDYLGAYTANQNNQLGLQNTQNASNASLFGSVANLAGAGLMSGFWK